jgi:DNA polymerase V
MFNPDEPKFSKGIVCELPYPTDDTRLVIHTALAGLEQIYRTGYAYAKAEILLMDLRQPGEFTEDLFAEVQPAAAARVMGVLDQINGRWGKGTLRPASVPGAAGWGMRQALKSPSYTTAYQSLKQASCN